MCFQSIIFTELYVLPLPANLFVLTTVRFSYAKFNFRFHPYPIFQFNTKSIYAAGSLSSKLIAYDNCYSSPLLPLRRRWPLLSHYRCTKSILPNVYGYCAACVKSCLKQMPLFLSHHCSFCQLQTNSILLISCVCAHANSNILMRKNKIL